MWLGLSGCSVEDDGCADADGGYGQVWGCGGWGSDLYYAGDYGCAYSVGGLQFDGVGSVLGEGVGGLPHAGGDVREVYGAGSSACDGHGAGDLAVGYSGGLCEPEGDGGA